MEKSVAQLATASLAQLTTPPEKPPSNTSEIIWDWQWELAGNETPEESSALTLMLTRAHRFIVAMENGEEPHWLVLLGTPACGKTHLADKIRWFLKVRGARLYNRHGRPKIDPQGTDYLSLYSYAQEGAIMLKWGKLINEMRDGERRLYNLACRDYFKVIDDLGVDSFDKDGNVTPFACQKMSEILDQRLGKWTVITANYPIKQIAQIFDTRIASRLMRGDANISFCDVRDFNVRKLNLKSSGDSASSRR